MKPNHRQPLFRMSRPSREQRRGRKAKLDSTDEAVDQRNGENAAEIARIRLMKDVLGQYWASRTTNR